MVKNIGIYKRGYIIYDSRSSNGRGCHAEVEDLKPFLAGYDRDQVGAYLFIGFCNRATIDLYLGISLPHRLVSNLIQIERNAPSRFDLLAIAHFPTWQTTRACQRDFEILLERWRANGRWYENPDRLEFNRIHRQLFAQYSTPSWRVSWKHSFSGSQLDELLGGSHRDLRIRL